MINKRVLVLTFELLSLLLTATVSVHAAENSVDVFDGTTPVIDGKMAPSEWNDAAALSFNFTVVHLKHDAEKLYIAFNISDTTFDPAEGLYLGLDTSHDGGSSIDPIDDVIIGTFRNGTAFETDGTMPLPPSPGWNVSVFEEAAGYTVEFNVTYGRIGIASGENKTLGLLLLSYDSSAFQYSIWPIMGMMDIMSPSNWGDMNVVFQIEPVYIRPDGSIEGTDKIVSMDNVTYTFISNISAPIVVQRSNIVIDGEGWTLDGLDYTFWEGFNLTAVTNVKISDVNIEGFASYSIYLKSAHKCNISENTVSGSEGGIGLFSSTENTVSNNAISGCSEAVELVSSYGNIISGNNMSDSNSAVHSYNSGSNVISGNNVTDNDWGIILGSSSDFNTVTGNNITANWNAGIRLEASSDNSISGNTMASNGFAMWLMQSSRNFISDNNATYNEGGIWLTSASSDNTVQLNSIIGSVEAVALDSPGSGNMISSNFLAEGHYGVYARNSSGNLISENNITANRYSGVYLLNSTDNTILRNDITNNSLSVQGRSGIELDMSSNNLLEENNIRANNWWGINPVNSNNNTIIGNNVIDNNVGLNFASSTDNTISGNNIGGSIYAGIYLDDASNNTFYHNNFFNNTNHAVVSPPDSLPIPNTWDNGFEGNYWSNYTGADANHDGIGDSAHVLDLNNTDNAPLLGPFNSYSTPLKKPVNVISNSTVTGFQYESPSTIRFSVSNMTGNQTHGFCRVMLPHSVLSAPYNVTVNGASPTYVNYTLHDNGTHRWIYFEYEHSTSEVVIIPEFPFFEILPLLMMLMSLAALVYKRKQI